MEGFGAMVARKVLMPSGEVRTYYCGDDQTWLQVITEKILPYWQSYCDNNWISPNHEAVYAPEKRVKWFLDRLGWLLIEGADGIESEYKRMVHEVREIPESECPAEISDAMYSTHTPPPEEETDGHFEQVVERLKQKDKRKPSKNKRPHIVTLFERIENIRKIFPGCKFTWCIVDSDNTFTYDGRRYVVPDEMRGYIEDSQMDRILAVETDKALRFYDQMAENMYIVR